MSGTQFVVDGEPLYFVGANLNVMHSAQARAGAAQTIAAAAADGVRVGRVWALGEGVVDAPDWKAQQELFRRGPDGWQEEAFRQLDRVIAEAGKRGIRLVIALSNRWADYGGIPMYLRWAGEFDSEAYGYTDRFFTNPRVRRWFVAHLRRVVGRTNSITGVPYRDDPTIMTWQMQNEMTGTPEAAAARRSWFRDMAREVRRIDRNHLIVPGLIGYDLQLERENWIAMCSLPEVSYCDQHIYPEERLRSRGRRNLQLYIDDRVQLAHHVVGKPIVFGEYGFDRGSPAQRAQWHTRFLQRLFYNGGNGALVWIYQPTLSWKRRFAVLVDDRRSLPVRRALSRVARQIARRPPVARNPRLGPEVGDRPIAPTHATMVRRRAPFGRWHGSAAGQRELRIPVELFHRCHFEEAGSWDRGVLVHFYGRRTGWVEYRFRGPPGRPPQRLLVRARMSSEYPSRSAPPDGVSRIKVSIDGEQVAELVVPPDDGIGRWQQVVVDTPELLRRLPGRLHVLRFAVEEGPQANGLAIYGRETPLNREPVESPGPLSLIAVYEGAANDPAPGAGEGADR